MKRITRHNYEEFFLDYHEGKLTNEEKSMVLLFIETNADLQEEFYSFTNVCLEPMEDSRMEKSDLYNGPHHSNREDYFIGLIEGDLTDSELSQTHDLIRDNEAYQLELSVFEKTKLMPQALIFPEKKQLKKSTKVIPLLKFAVPAAAAVALLVILSEKRLNQDYRPSHDRLTHFNWMDSENTTPEQEFVQFRIEPNKKEQNQKNTSGSAQEVLQSSLKAISVNVPSAIPVELEKRIQSPRAKPEFTEEVLVAEIPTVIEKVTQLADETILGTPTEMATNEPLELLAKGIEKVTHKQTEITRSKSTDRRKVGFKFGKFEYSRSKGI